jgi:outer membrane protein assembly factor BamB
VIVVKYSDGVIVALDAPTGRVLWQDRVRSSDRDRYAGRRTGALTVYQPAGLFSARSSADGSSVLIVAGADQVRAYNPWTGHRYWEHVFTEHPGCHDIDWTGETTYVAKDACAAPAVLEIFDAGSGRALGAWKPPGASAGPAEEANWYVEPISCQRGHSSCRLIRAAAIPEVISGAKLVSGVVGVPAQTWRLNLDGTVTAERYAVADRPYALGESLIEENAGNGYVRAVERATGKVTWSSTEPAWLVAVNHTGVYAITRDYWLMVLNPATGAELSRTHLRDSDNENWLPGQVHVAGRFVVIERVNRTGTSATDEQYYFTSTPVVLVGV